MAPPLSRLDQAARNPRQLAQRAMKDPALLTDLSKGLSAQKTRTKYGCAKALRIVSEAHPELIYPQFEFFVQLLDSSNAILQWEAAFVLSQLARADCANQFTSIFEKYFSPIRGPVMITAANVIRGGGRIARAKPELADRIAAEVLKVARARYATPECRNVAIGHAILALGEFVELLSDPNPVRQFVRRQLRNSRPATRKKAAQFLRRSARLPLRYEEQAPGRAAHLARARTTDN